jgi:hypothetical protein
MACNLLTHRWYARDLACIAKKLYVVCSGSMHDISFIPSYEYSMVAIIFNMHARRLGMADLHRRGHHVYYSLLPSIISVYKFS